MIRSVLHCKSQYFSRLSSYLTSKQPKQPLCTVQQPAVKIPANLQSLCSYNLSSTTLAGMKTVVQPKQWVLFSKSSEVFRRNVHHNEIERIYWLRSIHPILCLPDMATKQNRFCNTRESLKNWRLIGSWVQKKAFLKELKLLVSLYMEMDDILMLLAILNDKYLMKLCHMHMIQPGNFKEESYQ